MKTLTQKDAKVLQVLKEYPQGATLSQIQRFADIKRKEYALYYVKKLIRKGQARKQGHLYFHITLVGGTETYHSKPLAKQRPHAFQINSLLFRSYWERLPSCLESMKIPYHKELKQNLIRFTWQGREYRATSQYLYTFVELPEMPLNVPIEQVKLNAAAHAAPFLEALLTRSGLRCMRDRLGSLALEVHYWENGYPGNEIAQESLKDKSRIVYAYDLATGKVRAWADSSLGDLKELETNSETVDTQMKLFIQAVENGEIAPYRDEIYTRKTLDQVHTILDKVVATQESQLQFFQNHNAYMLEAAERERAATERDKEFLKMLKKMNQRRL